MARRYRFVQVDVFTDHAVGGNQLAVVTDARADHGRDAIADARDELVGARVCLARRSSRCGETGAHLLFTPARELPLAGHPPVGTSYVLARQGVIPLHGAMTEIMLALGVGPVPVVIAQRDGQPSFVWMTPPAPVCGPVRDDRARGGRPRHGGVRSARHLAPAGCLDGRALPLCARAVAACHPDAAALSALFADGAPASLLVFSRETIVSEATVHARMFAPHTMGIPEDPASGAAAGPLGASLAHDGGLPLVAETRFIIEQRLEMGRPRTIHVVVRRRDANIMGPRVGGRP